jgi:hypothetical protein
MKNIIKIVGIIFLFLYIKYIWYKIINKKMISELLLISKNTKFIQYLNYLGLKYDDWNSDFLSEFNKIKEKYSYVFVDKNGYILIAYLKNDDKIISNDKELKKYNVDVEEFKRDSLLHIRKLKIKTIK